VLFGSTFLMASMRFRTLALLKPKLWECPDNPYARRTAEYS
jgi:hypothetical protein